MINSKGYGWRVVLRYYDSRINPEHKKRNHIRQFEALGYKVTLEPAGLRCVRRDASPAHSPPISEQFSGPLPGPPRGVEDGVWLARVHAGPLFSTRAETCRASWPMPAT